MNDKTENLLPCPFCGGTDLSTETMSVQPDDFHDAHIECNECEARGRRAYTLEGWLPNKAEAKDEAVVAWNRRALPTPAVSEAPSIASRARYDPLFQAMAVRYRNEDDTVERWAALAGRADELIAAAVHARAEELARTFVRDVAAERDAALAELAKLRAQVPQAGAGADDEPDGCPATGQLCSYAPHGPRGESQCEYCGKEDQRARAAPPAAELPALPTDAEIFDLSLEHNIGGSDYRVLAFARDLLALRQPQGDISAALKKQAEGAAAFASMVAAKQAGKEGG